jgi:hypothetical protein
MIFSLTVLSLCYGYSILLILIKIKYNMTRALAGHFFLYFSAGEVQMIIMMRKTAIPALVCAASLLASCSSSMVNTRSIKMEMSGVKRMIQGDRAMIARLKDKRINKRGFFYVIDSTGRVIYHPQELLIGRNFSNYWFIKHILQERSGCLSYTVGDQDHYIFYESLQGGEILCYSVAALDLEGPAERCKRLAPEDVEETGSDDVPVVEP